MNKIKQVENLQENLDTLDEKTSPQSIVDSVDQGLGYTTWKDDPNPIYEEITIPTASWDFSNSDVIYFTDELTSDLEVTSFVGFYAGTKRVKIAHGGFNVTFSDTLVAVGKKFPALEDDGFFYFTIDNNGTSLAPDYNVNKGGRGETTGAGLPAIQTKYITTEDILSLGTPILIVPAPALDYVIDPLSLIVTIELLTDYITNTSLAIRWTDGTPIQTINTGLANGVGSLVNYKIDFPSIVNNEGIEIISQGGDPSGGQGSITVKYRITSNEVDSSNPPIGLPSATGVSLTGDNNSGDTKTLEYTFSANGGGVEAGTVINFYRADDAGGTNRSQIQSGASATYLLVAGDIGKVIEGEVIVANNVGEGAPVLTGYTAPIGEAAASPIWAMHGYSGEATNILYFATLLPSDYSSNEDLYPCMFFFHGSGEGSNGVSFGVAESRLVAYGPGSTIGRQHLVNSGGIAIHIQSDAATANPWDNMQANALTAMKELVEEYRIDPTKIVLTGLSSGATILLQVAWQVAQSDPALPFSALVPIANGFGADPPVTGSQESAMWQLGNDDDTSFYSKTRTDNTAGPAWDFDADSLRVRCTRYSASSGHGGWNETYGTSGGATIVDDVDTPLGASFPLVNHPDIDTDDIYDWAFQFKAGSYIGDLLADDCLVSESSVGDVSAIFNVSNVESGTIYLLNVADGAAAPSQWDMLSAYDQKVAYAGSVINPEITGLTASTAYDLYTMMKDEYGNLSTPQLTNYTTTAVPSIGRTWWMNPRSAGQPTIDTVANPEFNNSSTSTVDGTLTFDNIHDSDLNPSTLSVQINNDTTSLLNVNTTSAFLAESAAFNLPDNAFKTHWSAPSNALKWNLIFSGLDPAKSYRLTIWGIAQYTGRAGNYQFGDGLIQSTDSANVIVSGGGEQTEFPLVSPNGSGEIVLVTEGDNRQTISTFKLEEFN